MATSYAQETSSESPLRLRINAELIKSVFRKHDQELLELFKDIKLGDYHSGDDHLIKDLSVTFLPSLVSKDDYDNYISMNKEEFLGIESRDIKLVGSGSILHENKGEDNAEAAAETFTFEAPIDRLRVSLDIGDAPNNTYGTKGRRFFIQNFEFHVQDKNLEIKGTGASLPSLLSTTTMWKSRSGLWRTLLTRFTR